MPPQSKSLWRHQDILSHFFQVRCQFFRWWQARLFCRRCWKKNNLVEGNSKLGTTESAAMIAGPGLSGALVQILTAPIAIVIDAISFFVSAVFVWQIRAPEILVEKQKRNIWTEIGEGLRFVYGNKVLRPLAESIALYFLFRQIVLTLFTLYAIRELHLEPFLLGVIFSALGFGFLLGALTVKSTQIASASGEQ